jgi:hypothetical protein
LATQVSSVEHQEINGQQHAAAAPSGELQAIEVQETFVTMASASLIEHNLRFESAP